MSNKNRNENVDNVEETYDLNQEEITPVENDDDDDFRDPDLEEAMRIVERKKKIKAAGKTALGVAKKAGLVLLGVAIGAIAAKGKGAKGGAETASDSVGDTSDDAEDTTEDIVDDVEVDVENET